jgi:hypothetical protein
VPARVACMTALLVRLPAATQAPSAALVTPLQLQTCMSAGISSIVIFWFGEPRSNRRDRRSSGNGASR